MPIIVLTPRLVKSTTCPAGKDKVNIFDSHCKGLMLEVRHTGGKTFYMRYQDARGKTRQLRLADEQDVSLAQARQLCNQRRSQIALGIDPTADQAILRSVPTFADFIHERYMPFVKGYKKSWVSDDSYLRNHLLPAFGKMHLDEITKRDVIAFHHGMRTKDYALGTANRCLILLRYAMNLAVRWEIPGMKVNPTKDVALFEDHNGKERYLTQDEAQRIFEAVRQSENRMLQYIIPMLILTGARKREVLDAKWTDFDLDRKQWRIPTTKAGKPRHVPLSDGVLQLLDTIPHDDCVWVFANPKSRMPYVSIFCSWDTARKRAGLADVRIHDLRHSFASFLVNAGRSLYEVQKILGHTQVKTTQRYAHLSQDTLIDAANQVAKAVPLMLALPNRVDEVRLVRVEV
ncbi:MAG: integrase [Gallionellales bacterium RIFCSPHIGHO2_02_FULL_57_16]|nr:MAG: integrase [Gallionellales bacterium RIFCSPHIGHO2_02_FULL_57_16]